MEDAGAGLRGTGDAAAACAVTVVCLGLYVSTLTPGLPATEGDAPELMMAAATLGLAHPSGYPLYTWLGHVFTWIPVGDVAYRTNLLSAVTAAGAAGLLVLVGRRAGLPLALAAFAGLGFGLSATLWSQAVITEVYAPNACAVVLTWWLLLAWRAAPARGWLLVAGALVAGASLGLHLSSLSFVPAYVLFVLLVDPAMWRRPRLVTLAVAAALLGAAQFVWLPLRAGAALFPNAPPDTWAAVQAYTLGRVTSGSFTLPLAALPGRIVHYQGLLLRDFTLPGVVLGCAGMWRLAWTAPQPFWLLFGVYVTNVVLAARVGALDSEVFFVPSHAVFALFVGFGIEALARGLRVLGGRTPAPRAASVACGVLLFAALLPLARLGFARNDRATDTATGDFWRAAFGAVPRGSEILAGRGVFGQDVAYWRRFRGGRPDVVLPSIEPPLPASSSAQRFAKVRLAGSRLDRAARWALSPAALPPDPWAVATVVGSYPDLVLYRVTADPPALAVPDATPAHRLERPAGPHALLGYSVASRPTPDGRLRVRTFWRLADDRLPVVTTRLGGVVIEAHEVGRGNWQRLRPGRATAPGEVMVDDYELVVPSASSRGRLSLELGLVEFSADSPTVEWQTLGEIDHG
jgi:hypothetical protein